MIELLSVFQNVSGFYAVNGEYVLIQSPIPPGNHTNQAYCFSLYNNQSQLINSWEVDWNVGKIEIHEGSFYFVGKSQSQYCLAPKEGNISTIHEAEEGEISSWSGPDFILTDRNVFDQSISISNPLIKTYFSNGIRKWTNRENGVIRILEDNLLFLYPKHSIHTMDWQNSFCRVDPKTGTSMWCFDLEQNEFCSDLMNLYGSELRLKDPIGISNNQIWLSIHNKGLISLDTKTGILNFPNDIFTNQLSKLPQANNFPLFPNSDKSAMIKKEAKIVNLDHKYYWEFDLDSSGYEIFDLQDYFKEEKCMNNQQWNKLIVQGNSILGVSQFDKKLFSFSMKTRTFDWQIPTPESAGRPRAISKHNDMLYVDTFSKHLLVYKLINDAIYS